MKNLKIIISGGGTGGHIYPAVAIAQEIMQQYPGSDILFVGAKDKMEMEKVPRAGFPIEGLWISGLQRKLSLDNLSFPFKVIGSIYKSHQILKGFKPDAAIGVGGFASGPLLYAAAQRNIPTLIHEQNSYAGITNKWLSGKVNTICVAYDGMDKYFPKEKIVKTGNPVRNDLLELHGKKELAAKHFGLDSHKKTILVIGGSLGARTLNQSMKADIKKLQNEDIQVIWQTGKLYFDALAPLATSQIKIYDFIYQMDLAYAMADVVISRAGASSISEIAVVKKPAILVPSPNVAEDHQTKNAMALVSRNAALMVTDIDAASKLIPEAIALLNNSQQQQALISHLEPFAIADARQRIVTEVTKLVSM